MSNGQANIDKSTFKGMNAGDRDWITFMTLQEHIRTTKEKFDEQNNKVTTVEDKIIEIETHQKLDFKKMMSVAGVTGFIGGIAAVLGKVTIFKGHQ